MDPNLKMTVACTASCAVASLGVYALWIEPFLRRHLTKTAPFLFMLFAPMVDYRKARRLAKRRKSMPWFLRIYEILLALTILGTITSLLWLIVGFICLHH